jgi:putative ABC transport system permease protein
MMPLARIAYRNTLKNWRHSLAAIASISAGFLSLVLFQGYISDVNHLYEVGFNNRAMYGHLLIENPNVNTSEGKSQPEKNLISKAEQLQIDQFISQHRDKIIARVRFLPVTGTVTNGKNSFLFVAMGYDLKEGAMMRAPKWEWEVLYGQPLHVAQDSDVVVVGQALGFLLGCEPTPKIEGMVQNDGYKPEVRPFQCQKETIQTSAATVSGQLNAMDFKVVGIIDGGYKDIDEKWMKMSIENAQTLLNTEEVKFISVLMKKSNQADRFIQDFNQFAQKNALTTTATHWLKHPVADLFNKTQDLLGIFQIFIVTVTLTISGLSVLNTVVKSIKERTREIGALRSLGFSSQQVGALFTLEALYLSLMGVGIGFVLAIGITFFVNQSTLLYRAGLLSEPVVFRIAYDFSSYLFTTVLLSVLAVLTSHFAVKSTVSATVAANLSNE